MEPLPLAVICDRAYRDAENRLTIEWITDTLVGEGSSLTVPEFQIAAVFEADRSEVSQIESVPTRIVDADGIELDSWRFKGIAVQRAGSPNLLYYLVVRFTLVSFSHPGRHEMRIRYDEAGTELAIPFELERRSEDV